MRRLSNVVLGLSIGALALSLGWLASRPHNALPNTDAFFDIVVLGVAVLFAFIGRLIVGRAHNRIGVVFAGLALGGATLITTDILVKTTPIVHPAWLPWVGVATIVGQMLTVASITILLPIFPTGTLAGRRWRWVGWTFSCLEALQNVAKYAAASRASIVLSNGSGTLRFSVTDDGEGFDPSSMNYGTGLQGIADRLAAIGGTLDITSTPGAGTTVSGAVATERSP